MLAVILVALVLTVSGCSAMGAAASLAGDAIGQPSASKTPFPVTVQSPASDSLLKQAENLFSAGPSQSVSPASPSPTHSSTELNPGDVIQSVQNHLPIGLQFLVQQIQSLAGMFTGKASATPSN